MYGIHAATVFKTIKKKIKLFCSNVCMRVCVTIAEQPEMAEIYEFKVALGQAKDGRLFFFRVRGKCAE